MQLVEPRPSRPMPIRITPLIDVVFILLVFFMLTSRLLPVDYLELANDTRAQGSQQGDPSPRWPGSLPGCRLRAARRPAPPGSVSAPANEPCPER